MAVVSERDRLEPRMHAEDPKQTPNVISDCFLAEVQLLGDLGRREPVFE
jgi:hypothetical protein